MSKPNKDDLALLQARHLYNDAEIEKVIDGHGFTIGKDTLVIKVNRLCWGYFEQSILNALKDKKEARDWSPELFADDKECPECKGVGKFPYVGKEYDDALKEHNDGLEETDYFYCKPGSEIARFCSPCQGTGIVLKTQPQKE